MKLQRSIKEVYPEIPYDMVAPTLSLAPRFEDGTLRFSVALSGEPYRLIPASDPPGDPPEFVYENYGSHLFRFGTSDVHEAAKSDPALAVCIKKVQDAIQEFLESRGL